MPRMNTVIRDFTFGSSAAPLSSRLTRSSRALTPWVWAILISPEPAVEIDIEGPFLILPGDLFILCSDGLSGELSDEEIGALAAELSPAQACRSLVHMANLRGGADNCTVTIVRVAKGGAANTIQSVEGGVVESVVRPSPRLVAP